MPRLDLVDLQMLAWEGVRLIVRAWIGARGEVAGLLPALRESLPPPWGSAWVMPLYGAPEGVVREVALMSGLRESHMASRLVVVRLDGVGSASGYRFYFAVDTRALRRGFLEVYVVFEDPESEVCYRSAMGGEAGP